MGAADPSGQAWYVYDKHEAFQSGLLNAKFLVEQNVMMPKGCVMALSTPQSVSHHHTSIKPAEHYSWYSYCKLLQIAHVLNLY